MNPSHLPTLMAVALSRLLLRLRSMRTLLIFEMRATCWLTLSDVYSFIYSSYVVSIHIYIYIYAVTLYPYEYLPEYFSPCWGHMSCSEYAASGDLCWVVGLLYYHLRISINIISTHRMRISIIFLHVTVFFSAVAGSFLYIDINTYTYT